MTEEGGEQRMSIFFHDKPRNVTYLDASVITLKKTIATKVKSYQRHRGPPE